MTKREYKVVGMDCPSCAMLIEGELEDVGVKKAKCSYINEILEVEFDEEKINEQLIKETVKQAGYTLELGR